MRSSIEGRGSRRSVRPLHMEEAEGGEELGGDAVTQCLVREDKMVAAPLGAQGDLERR